MSGRYYSQEIIDENKEQSRYNLACVRICKITRKAGKNYVGGRCPFHQEKTPSFTVDPDKRTFYCFGCGQEEVVFTFLMKNGEHDLSRRGPGNCARRYE